MKLEEQIRYSSLGDSYWWLAGKYKVVARLLKKLVDDYPVEKKEKIKILDIGCGPGNLINDLSNLGVIFGMDISLKALTLCREKNREKSVQLINGRADELPIITNSIDIAILLDVLEHAIDDRKVIKEIYRVLNPEGMVLLTVPAYHILWGSHDEIYQHYRRYRLNKIKQIVEEAGFIIKKLTAFEAIFFLPLLLFRKIKLILNNYQSDDFIKVSRYLNYILTKIILFEGWVASKISHPFGVSIICTARKMNLE